MQRIRRGAKFIQLPDRQIRIPISSIRSYDISDVGGSKVVIVCSPYIEGTGSRLTAKPDIYYVYFQRQKMRDNFMMWLDEVVGGVNKYD